jgi:hypothetical protein
MSEKYKAAVEKCRAICKDVADRLDAGTLDDAGAVDILRPAIFELWAEKREAHQAMMSAPEFDRIANSAFADRLLRNEGAGHKRLKELSRKEKS